MLSQTGGKGAANKQKDLAMEKKGVVLNK